MGAMMYCKAFFFALTVLLLISAFFYLAAENPILLTLIAFEIFFISLLEIDLDWIAS